MNEKILHQLTNDLAKTEAKLKDLRLKWVSGSSAYKKVIETIAKIETDKRDLLKHKIDSLKKNVETQNLF
jgi:hypothetical protein